MRRIIARDSRAAAQRVKAEMAKPARDVIVIGGSAGAVEVLRTVFGDLPVDLGAAVAITLHRSPTLPSSLAGVFARRSSLDVIEPEDGEPFVPGRIYLAPPDRHMLICNDVIRLNRGPRQHHTRPAIDPMFKVRVRLSIRRCRATH